MVGELRVSALAELDPQHGETARMQVPCECNAQEPPKTAKPPDFDVRAFPLG